MKIEIRKRIATSRSKQIPHESGKAIYSRTPIAVREVFAAANELPLAFLGFLASSIGSLVLWSYFKSVGYVPDDLLALLGLGVFISSLSLLVLILLAVSSLMPALFGRTLSLQLHPLQTSAALATSFALSVAYIFTDDGTYLPLFLTVLAGVTTAAWFLVPSYKKQFVKNICCSLIVFLLGFPTFFIAYVVVNMSSQVESSDLQEWSTLLLTMTVFIGTNAAILKSGKLPWDQLKEWQKWGFALCINALFILIMLTLAPQSTFPKWAATSLGIRIDSVAELVVPENTCATIRSRMFAAPKHSTQEVASTKCEHFGNQVKAEVKVRLGRSWLVCVRELNGVAIDKPFTMTIPSTGTELIVKGKTDMVVTNSKNVAKDHSCDFLQREKGV